MEKECFSWIWISSFISGYTGNGITFTTGGNQMANTALLIIDVQVAMFSPLEGPAVWNGEKVLHNIDLLLEKARESGMPVIFIQHTDPDDPEYAEGLPTWHIHPEITPLPSETVIKKRHWDSFQNTLLQDILDEKGICRLIIIGMQTEYCYDTTVRSALAKDYEVIVVKDGHTTFDSPQLKAEQIIAHHNRVLGSRAEIKSTQEIVF